MFFKGLFGGLIFGGAYLWREICASKSTGLALFTIFALFYLVFEGISKYKLPGAYNYMEGNSTEDFLHFKFGGLIFGGVQ